MSSFGKPYDLSIFSGAITLIRTKGVFLEQFRNNHANQ